jgi:hypothetical protein
MVLILMTGAPLRSPANTSLGKKGLFRIFS